MRNNQSIPSYTELGRFFVPLGFQTMAQLLTFPLVSTVAAKGAGGVLNTSGLAQAHMVMWLIGALGNSMITTGMVFGGNREGYAQFKKANLRVIAISLGVYGLLCFPPVTRFIFSTVIGLPESIATAAGKCFWASVPLLGLFLIRTPFLATLLIARQGSKAFFATLFRLAGTLVVSMVAPLLGLAGPVAAVGCLLVPLVVEVLVMRAMSAQYVDQLPKATEAIPCPGRMVSFSLPFATGLLLFTLAFSIAGAVIARAPQPQRMLPVFHVAMGLATPVAVASVNMRAVAISFSGSRERNLRVMRFGIYAGLLLGGLPLLVLAPSVIGWYYHGIQSIPLNDLGLARATALALFLFPMSSAMRGFSEGRASFLKKPMVVLIGQSSHLGTVTLVSGALLVAGLGGNLIGPAAITIGNMVSSGCILGLLGSRWGRARWLQFRAGGKAA